MAIMVHPLRKLVQQKHEADAFRHAVGLYIAKQLATAAGASWGNPATATEAMLTAAYAELDKGKDWKPWTFNPDNAATTPNAPPTTGIPFTLYGLDYHVARKIVRDIFVLANPSLSNANHESSGVIIRKRSTKKVSG